MEDGGASFWGVAGRGFSASEESCLQKRLLTRAPRFDVHVEFGSMQYRQLADGSSASLRSRFCIGVSLPGL